MSEEAVLDREKDPDLVSGESVAGAEADDAVDGASAPAVRQAPPEPSARRRFGIVEVVALIVIVALAVALIISRVQLSNQDSLNAARSGAVAAAKTDAIDVATYSYLHLHRDFGKVEAQSTPSFRRSFIRSSGSLSKVLVQYKATASAKVVPRGRGVDHRFEGGRPAVREPNGGELDPAGSEHGRQPYRGHARAQRQPLVAAGPQASLTLRSAPSLAPALALAPPFRGVRAGSPRRRR